MDLNYLMWKVSRYWNRLAYLLIHTGHRMIWDYTGDNSDLLEAKEFTSKTTEAILTDRG